MFLLDTNVVSEMRKIKSGKVDENVKIWLSQQDPSDFFINSVTLMELERGILAIERKDAIQGAYLRMWKTTFFQDFLKNPILTLDEQTAHICAELHVPDRTPENDAWIAASAIQHHLILVTRNTKDFVGCGVKLLNPFEG